MLLDAMLPDRIAWTGAPYIYIRREGGEGEKEKEGAGALYIEGGCGREKGLQREFRIVLDRVS